MYMYIFHKNPKFFTGKIHTTHEDSEAVSSIVSHKIVDNQFNFL